MTQPPTSPQARRTPWWRWVLSGVAMAVAWAVVMVTWAFAAFVTCGISGCSGGGFGPAYGRWYEVLIPLGIGGVALCGGILTFPWGTRRRLGTVIALAVGGVYVLVTAVVQLSQIPGWGF